MVKCIYCGAENDGAYKGPCPQCESRDQLGEKLQDGIMLTDDADIRRLIRSYSVPWEWINKKHLEEIWEFCGDQWNPDWRWKNLDKLDRVALYLLWQELKKQEEQCN